MAQIPTGHTSEVVQDYYQYLYGRYYGTIPLDRAEGILTSSIVTVFAWGAILILAFFLLTYSLKHAHRRRGELYEAVSFAGSLLERNGRVSAFTWILIAGLFLVVIFEGVQAIMIGFPY